MNVACVNEGDTEYVCVPKLVGNLGHVVISNVNVGGCGIDWDSVLEKQIVPYVRTAALKQPDKILIVIDRENRPGCCPMLAARAVEIIRAGLLSVNLVADIAMVISDRRFESIVMADYELVDRLPILARPVSPEFGPNLDGKNPKAIIDAALKPGMSYNKVRHGAALASRMRIEDPAVLARSRSLRKLVSELPRPHYPDL